MKISAMPWKDIYRTDPGQQVNNDVEQRQLSGTFKAQVTPQDTVYLQVQTVRSKQRGFVPILQSHQRELRLSV